MPDLASAISRGIFADPGKTESGGRSSKFPISDDIRRLTDALKDALEGMEDMFPYVPEFFQEKWEHQGYIDRARKALGAANANA